MGWSFGTELALRYGSDPAVAGAILLSPPLIRAGDGDLDGWAATGRPLLALVPEFDDYLRPDEARARFARVPQAEVVGVDGAKHLWVGEKYVVHRAEPDRPPGQPGRLSAARRMEGLTVSLFDLTGKKAFVTGASRGIGQVMAVAFAEAGADVALVARGADGLAETASAVEAAGRKAFVIPADVTSHEQVAAAVSAAIGHLGHVDIVVNNAGGSNFMVGFRDLRLSGWDKIMQLNLNSAVYVCHAFAGHLLERGQGSVINVASVAGVVSASPCPRTGRPRPG